jgi:pimeloyl-ACP methyl ester carboxylesterase
MHLSASSIPLPQDTQWKLSTLSSRAKVLPTLFQNPFTTGKYSHTSTNTADKPPDLAPCCGSFCHLAKYIDHIQDTLTEEAEKTIRHKPRSHALAAKDERRRNARQRATRILCQVLSNDEYQWLEDTGNIVEFNMKDNVTKVDVQKVSMKSYNLAEMENRAALSHLKEAEASDCSFKEENCSEKRAVSPREPMISAQFETRSVEGLTTCGVCFNVYALLDNFRLLSEHPDTRKKEPAKCSHMITKAAPEVSTEEKTVSRKQNAKAQNCIQTSYHGELRIDSTTSPENCLSDNGSSVNGDKHQIGITVTQNCELCSSDATQDAPRLAINSFVLSKKDDGPVQSSQREVANVKHRLNAQSSPLSEEESIPNGAEKSCCTLSSADALQTTQSRSIVPRSCFETKAVPLAVASIRPMAAKENGPEMRGNSTHMVSLVQPETQTLQHETSKTPRKENATREKNTERYGSKSPRLPNCAPSSKGQTRGRRRLDSSTNTAKRVVSNTKRVIFKSTASNKKTGHKREDEPTVCGPRAARNKKAGHKAEASYEGTMKYSESIDFPFAILKSTHGHIAGAAKYRGHSHQMARPVCNLVVCHDIFETYEKMKVFLQPLVLKYPRLQILLWNYPGQALTSFGDKDILNNELHSSCLHELLGHVDREGLFSSSYPFFVLAHGNGAMIALKYCTRFSVEALKGILLVNGLTHVDSYYASVLTECREVFTSSTEDLSTYFYAKYIFSETYLKEVSPPLALSMYAAASNPISREGRIGLCNGALSHLDLRQSLATLKKPIIALYGRASSCVQPEQTSEVLRVCRIGKLCKSIKSTLEQDGIYLIPVDGGHDLIQERKPFVTGVLEHLLAVSSFQWPVQLQLNAEKMSDIGDNEIKSHQRNTIFARLNDIHNASSTSLSYSAEHVNANKDQTQPSPPPTSKAALNSTSNKLEQQQMSFDPSDPSFYESGSGTLHDECITHKTAPAKSEIKEYMTWRLKRNQNRLIRLDQACRQMQQAARAMFARSALLDLKTKASAMVLQKAFRGCLGKQILREKRRDLESIKFTQRALRGYLARTHAYRHRKQIEFQIKIARRLRGRTAKHQFMLMIERVRRGATAFQAAFRIMKARDGLKQLWIANFSCIVIQKVRRGHAGRVRATQEKDKFLLGHLQGTSIEYGKKLMDKYTSEVEQLKLKLFQVNKDKTLENTKFQLLKDKLAEDDDKVKNLQKYMHEITSLSKVDVRGAARDELRAEKAQMDSNYGIALAQISTLEGHLQEIEQNIKQLAFEEDDTKEKLRTKDREINLLMRQHQEHMDQHASCRRYAVHSGGADWAQRPKCTSRDKAPAELSSAESMLHLQFMKRCSKQVLQNGLPRIENDCTFTNNKNEDAATTRTDGGVSKKGHILNWSVEDVLDWLSMQKLSQYHDEFEEAAIDGFMLISLSEEDLTNTMGIEHKLHCKKILLAAQNLRSQMHLARPPLDKEHITRESNASLGSFIHGENAIIRTQSAELQPQTMALFGGHPVKTGRTQTHPNSRDDQTFNFNADEVFLWVRHQKVDILRKALQSIPDKKFEPSKVRAQFSENYGTDYHDSLPPKQFYINTTDDEGNTSLHVAAQNGNMKIGRFLVQKGANPNHQNKKGRTPAHYAVLYNYTDFAAWLFSPDVGGNDFIADIDGRDPYEDIKDDT